ncbi:MAG: hypothetical protein IPI82_08990 [Candidatus Microthrix sp.]|nr:hypothetical protein [Candidatus Microthrix sp.]
MTSVSLGTVVGVNLLVKVPSPNCPCSLAPQQAVVPFRLRAHEETYPAVMAVTS